MIATVAMFKQEELSATVAAFDKVEVLDYREYLDTYYVKHTLETVVGRAANGTPRSQCRIGGNRVLGVF